MTESRVYHRKMLSSATDNTWWHIQRESLGVLIGNPPPDLWVLHYLPPHPICMTQKFLYQYGHILLLNSGFTHEG